MGCDIHMYSETLDENDHWIADAADTFTVEKDDPEDPDEEGWFDMDQAQHDGRNYWLFGLLHPGVRTEWPFSFEIKGWPDDASDHTDRLYRRWEGDAHSPNHLTKRELLNKAAELLISSEEHAQALAGYLQDIIQGLDGDPDRQRVVFWFDN